MAIVLRKSPIGVRAIVTVVFLALCFIGFNAEFLLGMLGIPLAVWALSGAWTAARNGRQRLFLRRCAAIACGGVLLVGAPLSCSMQTRGLEQAIAPTLAALERYRADRGEYPKQLDDLVPAYLAQVPKCRHAALAKVGYFVEDAKAGDIGPPGFVITCNTYALNKHSYASTTRHWADWD